MLDINEIRKRAQQASERAADSMKKTFEKSEELVQNLEISSTSAEAPASADETEEQVKVNTERQVEILGQIFGADSMAQIAANEEQLQKMVDEKIAQVSASAAENWMDQLFGEDMGVLAAALEMLETEDADDEETLSFDSELEESLYATLEEPMAQLEAMP